jgi:uncharacterized protein YqeY
VGANPYCSSQPFEGEEWLLIPESASDPITEEAIRDVIVRQADQRRESIEAFRRGNRNDLADKEAAELRILDEYLTAASSR